MTIGTAGSCESSRPISPSRTRTPMNSASRGGKPTNTWPSGTSTAETSSRSPLSSKRRRSSCIGTYGRDLMKRRSWAAVGPCTSPVAGGGLGAASSMGACVSSVVMVGSPSRLSIIASIVASTTDNEQVAGDLVERIKAVVGTHDDVLDARAVLALDVDARLDAERVANFDRLVVAGDHVRILMTFEPNSVSGSMDEQVTHARLGDDRARRGVDLLALDTRPNRVARRLLRVLKDVVQLRELVGRARVVVAGHPHGPGDVRAVARDRPADVNDDRLTGPDD